MPRIPYVDPDLCTGCELCAETAPSVFHMEGDVAVVSENYEPDNDVDVQEAMDNCPVEAISWQD